MFLGFTTSDNTKMIFTILNRFCLACFLSIHLFFSAGVNIHVFQKPRFVGMRTGRTVRIYCVPSTPSLPAHVEWFKVQAKNSQKHQLKNSQRIKIKEKSDTINASIIISNVEIEDSGTYFCKLNSTFGPGTELQVLSRCQVVDVFACFLRLYTCISLSVSSPGYADPQAVLSRSRVKDVFIFLQGLLLILCIAVPLVQFYRLVRATTFPQTDLCTFSCKVSIAIFSLCFRRRKKKPFMKSLRMITYMR